MRRVVDRRRCPARSSQGSVTAETALVLPAVAVLLAGVLALGSAVVAQVACVDAARAGARAAARGDPLIQVLGQARSLAPAGAGVRVAHRPADVTVMVRARIVLPLPGSPGIVVAAEALAQREDARSLAVEEGTHDPRP